MSTSLAHCTPPGLIRVDGKLVVRRVFLEPDPSAPILCRNHHEITRHADIFDGIGAYDCGSLLGPGHHGPQACGAIVGVIEGSTAASVRFDLTADERNTIKHRRMRAPEILDFLGLTL